MRLGRRATVLAVLALAALACSTPAPSPTPTATANPSPTASSSATVDGAIVHPGDTVTIDAVEPAGTWGSITLTRAADVGGYPTQAINANSFIIELFVRYIARRQPTSTMIGSGDWSLVTADDRTVAGQFFVPPQPADPAKRDAHRQPIGGGYPGAVDLVTTGIQGALFFEVPRGAASRSLELLYQPPGLDHPVAVIQVRPPAAAPDPVPTATPVPTPAPVTYVTKPGAPFAVIDSAQADALFGRLDTCTNPVGHFTVSFPAGWYTNRTVGTLPACSWFAPTPFAVTGGAAVPNEVAIVFRAVAGSFGSVTSPDYGFSGTISIGGHAGFRGELIGMGYPAGGHEWLPPSYLYTATFGVAGQGPSMRASTSSVGTPDYILNKAVLDRIVASLVYHG